MYDPISVETALVSAGGDLLIQLSDGNVINAGRVRGNPGPQGEKGEQGVRGAHGKDGIDGTNGAKWHTGVGAPELDLGVDGDLYMDVASSLLPIFQKVGGNWLFLANLKAPASGGGGGGSSAAGGGGAIIIHPGPTPPTNDNNGRPIDIGDIWFDSETGLIWVWDGNVWAPVGDHPPVIISPTPPDYNSSSDDNYEYPVKEGDLWFDSEQLALYVAAENQAGDLVWIISTPANRSGVSETVSNPFVFPVAIDGETIYNPTSDTWYVWNESKKQWIDIPTNCQTTDYVYKGEGTDPGEGEFKIGAGSTPELAEIYLFGDKRPFLKDGGYLFINDESHTIVYANYDSATNTTVVAITPGLENLVLDESYNFSSCAPFIEKQEVYYGEQKPTVEDDDLEIGNIWIDKEDNKLYVWDGTAWSEVTACSAIGMGEYVKRSGDSMYGDLLFKWDKDTEDEDYLLSIRTNNTYNPKQRNFYGDYTEFKVENALFVGPKTDTSNCNFEVWGTLSSGNTSHYLEVTGYELWSGSYDKDGNVKSTLKHASDGDFRYRADVSGSGSFLVDVITNGSRNDYISFFSDTTTSINSISGYRLEMDNDKGLTYNDNIELDADPYTVTNKQYVDAQDEKLQLEAEVLQREIEAISPTTDKGIWQDGASATPGTGHFAMRRQGGAITQDYTQTDIDTLIISTTDKNGGGHSFEAEEVGDLIQLFDVEDKNYGLFEIEAIDTGSSTEYVSFTVKWLQGIGETHVDDDVLIKTFAPPTGGTASEFVLKAGDNLTGTLAWNNKAGSTENPYVGVKILENSKRGSKTILWAESGGSFTDGQLVTELVPTLETSITNKKYVDDKFDFSQYTELS